MQKYIIAYYALAFYNIPGEYHEYTRSRFQEVILCAL